MLHYIITVSWRDSRGANQHRTINGTLASDTTRRDQIFLDVLQKTRTLLGLPADYPVCTDFYSLEPLHIGSNPAPSTAAPAIVERTYKDPDHLEFGAYRVYWKSDPTQSSIAAIGQDSAGRYWLAPTNWVTVPTFDWSGVERVELIAKWPEDRANTTAEENR